MQNRIVKVMEDLKMPTAQRLIFLQVRFYDVGPARGSLNECF